MIEVKEAKSRAKILSTFLAEQGITLSHGLCLEAIARTEHHKNWATYLAAVSEDASFTRRFEDVKDWPVFVFYYDYMGDEYLNVFPVGVTLDNPAFNLRWGGMDDDYAIAVPEGLQVLSNQVVVSRVSAVVPSIDEYGLPEFANDRTACSFFKEELGCASLPEIEVLLKDTGDDSVARFWFEAHVHPELAKSLLAVTPSMEWVKTDKPWRSADVKLSPDIREALEAWWPVIHKYLDLSESKMAFTTLLDTLDGMSKDAAANMLFDYAITRVFGSTVKTRNRRGVWQQLPYANVYAEMRREAKDNAERLALRK